MLPRTWWAFEGQPLLNTITAVVVVVVVIKKLALDPPARLQILKVNEVHGPGAGPASLLWPHRHRRVPAFSVPGDAPSASSHPTSSVRAPPDLF